VGTTVFLAGTDMGAMCTTLLFVLIGLAMFALGTSRSSTVASPPDHCSWP